MPSLRRRPIMSNRILLKLFYYSTLIAAVALFAAGCGKTTGETSVFDGATGKHISDEWPTVHGATYAADQALCRSCHGQDLAGGTSGVSCADCHLPPHKIPFPDHDVVDGDCTSCHGANYGGGRFAPACSSCHINLYAGLPPAPGECTSCHGITSGPDGRIFPNRSGAHGRHYLRTGHLGCDICHSGEGSGTADHGYRSSAPVSFSRAVSVRGGSAAFNGSLLTCANISCHGGKTTPPWNSGHLNSLSDCAACHASGTGMANPPANSYLSGWHDLHLIQIGLACIDCHDSARLFPVSGPTHFSNLTTARFELSPAGTLRNTLNYADGRCSPSGGVTFSPCHGSAQWR